MTKKYIGEPRKAMSIRFEPGLYKALKFAAVERETTMLKIIEEAVRKEIGYKPKEEGEKG